jgi:hypothetical protein
MSNSAAEFSAPEPSTPAPSAEPATGLPPLTDATLWAILNEELDDATVNQLVWYYLGYRQGPEGWRADQVAPDWQQDYPTPPDFIESRPATVKLTRSIPQANKQLLKEELGFKGYKVDELIPRKTRRATMANWLLSYRKQSA